MGRLAKQMDYGKARKQTTLTNTRARLFESRLNPNLGLNRSNLKLSFNHRLFLLLKNWVRLTSA